MKIWKVILIFIIIFTFSSCKKGDVYTSNNESGIARDSNYISDDKEADELSEKCLEFWEGIEDFKVQKTINMSIQNAPDTSVSETISQNSDNYHKSASITQNNITESYIKYCDQNGSIIKLNDEDPVKNNNSIACPEFKSDINEIHTFLNEVKNSPSNFSFIEEGEFINITLIQTEGNNKFPIEGIDEKIEIKSLDMNFRFHKSDFSPKEYVLNLVYSSANDKEISLLRKISFESVNTGLDIEKP